MFSDLPGSPEILPSEPALKDGKIELLCSLEDPGHPIPSHFVWKKWELKNVDILSRKSESIEDNSDQTNAGTVQYWRRAQQIWLWRPWVLSTRATTLVLVWTCLEQEKRILSNWKSQVSLRHLLAKFRATVFSPAKVLGRTAWEDNSYFGKGTLLPVQGKPLSSNWIGSFNNWIFENIQMRRLEMPLSRWNAHHFVASLGFLGKTKNH